MTNLLQRWTPLPSVPSSFPPNPQLLRSNSENIYGQVINLAECTTLLRRDGEPVGEALHCPRRAEQLSQTHIDPQAGVSLASQWREAAQQAVDEQGGEQLDQLRVDAADRLGEIRDRIQAILEEIHIDADMFDLPDVPELPVAELDGDRPEPLLDSRWNVAEQSRRLIASKNYDNGEMW